MLFEDKKTGETTWLMRHSYWPGDYCLRAAGTQHAAASKDGCTMMVIYRAARVA